MTYVGIVDHYSSEENALHLKRVGIFKSDLTWYKDATISEGAIESVEGLDFSEMQKYLKNSRDIIKNSSIH